MSTSLRENKEVEVSDLIVSETKPTITDRSASRKLEGYEKLSSKTSEFSMRPCLPGLSKIVQIVLAAALGSFLFGFNLSLLNTAMNSIFAEYKICGPADPLYADTSPSNCSAKCLADCDPSFRDDGTIEFLRCPGGANDVSCTLATWLKALLSCAVLIGATAGCLMGGKFIPHGRRMTLVWTMVVFCVGVISSVVSNSFSAIFWARLIVGYGVGVISVASPTFIAEVSPPAARGRYGVFHQLFIVIGILIGVLLGLALNDPSQQGDDWDLNTFQKFWWRFMLALGLLPVLLCLFVFTYFFTMETPNYYVEKGRLADAERVLRELYGDEVAKSGLKQVVEDVTQSQMIQRNGLSLGTAMKNQQYRYVIVVGCVLSAFQQLGGINVFMTSSNKIFEDAGFSGSLMTVMSVIMALLNCLMTFPTVYLIDKIGRRSLLLTGSFFQFIFVVPAAISAWTDSDRENPTAHTKVLSIIAVFGFVVSFAIAYGPVLWVYLFEIYPLEIKEPASAAATAVNWLSSIVMVFAASLLPNFISFTVFAILQLVGTIFIYFYMLETKGRRLGDSPFMNVKETAAV